MGRAWRALPILACAIACSPIKDYQEAARALTFHLDRVEPRLQLALPLERSQIAFRVTLGVTNPSTVPFHVVGFEGRLGLEAGGAQRAIGRIELAQPLELPAGGQGRLEAELAFTYQDLKDNWPALEAAMSGAPGRWHLEGTLRATAYGLPLQLPVRTSRGQGGTP